MPEHLKNNPYAHLSQEELMALYQEMMENPEKFKNPSAEPQVDKDGKPIVDPEGGCTI
jgi:hypothetical protein